MTPQMLPRVHKLCNLAGRVAKLAAPVTSGNPSGSAKDGQGGAQPEQPEEPEQPHIDSRKRYHFLGSTDPSSGCSGESEAAASATSVAPANEPPEAAFAGVGSGQKPDMSDFPVGRVAPVAGPQPCGATQDAQGGGHTRRLVAASYSRCCTRPKPVAVLAGVPPTEVTA